MNVLILAAGPFDVEDQPYPFYLTEFGSKSLIEHILEASAALNPKAIILAAQEAEVTRFHLGNIASIVTSAATVLPVKGETKGAACTALLAARDVDNDDELLIISANEWVSLPYHEPIDDFRNRRIDAGTLVFRSLHPRYSYVRIEGDRVVEAAEKSPISPNACAGFYWFRRGRDFISGAKEMIRKDAHVDNQFFVAPVFNELILKQQHVSVYRLDAAYYHPIKNERQIDQRIRSMEERQNGSI